MLSGVDLEPGSGNVLASHWTPTESNQIGATEILPKSVNFLLRRIGASTDDMKTGHTHPVWKKHTFSNSSASLDLGKRRTMGGAHTSFYHVFVKWADDRCKVW